MTEWHIYSLATGQFLGRSFAVPGVADPDDEAVAQNTPAGCGVVTGVSDWRAQKVDLDTGRLVDWQPPAPPADEMRTWEWHWVARRWVSVPTLTALRADRLAEVQRAIEAAEAGQARPARELSLAAALGQPVPPLALARLQQLDVQVAWLRALRAQLGAANSAEELAAIPSLVEVTQA